MNDLIPGDKVVCVTAIAGREHDALSPLFSSLPKKGGIYCVSGVEESAAGIIIIDLVGIVSRPDGNGDEYGFRAEWFRRIIPASERNSEAKSARN
jgi:hypothetical protein